MPHICAARAKASPAGQGRATADPCCCGPSSMVNGCPRAGHWVEVGRQDGEDVAVALAGMRRRSR
jgi:hypothetical protein